MQPSFHNKIDWKNKQAIEEIVKNIETLNFGQLNVIVHNGRVVQIDVIEKKRFDKMPFDGNVNTI